jgi:hypothetical protein
MEGLNMKYISSVLFVFLFTFSAYAGDVEPRIKALEESIKAQEKAIAEQKRTIDELKAEKRAIKDTGTKKGSAGGGFFGGSALSNPNISLVLDASYYGSNLSSEGRAGWTIPGFINEGTGTTKGFNLGSAELFIFAPADPYFNVYATLPVTEDGVELEEAYFITTSLPRGLQVKGGKFKSGFGRINGQHPHQWDFADSPLPYRAFIGAEGIIETGAQLTWLPPLPFYALIGVEVLQGNNAILFGPDARSGPHAYAAFAKFSFDAGEASTLLFGPSIAIGKTKTGTIADNTEFAGDSTLYGLEATYKWNPSRDKSLIVQSEYLLRRQDGDLTDTVASTIERLERKQDGYYVQALYRHGRWGLGARYDGLNLFSNDYVLGGTPQDFGGDPWRATAAVEYNPTEFSKIRLQYNHDRSAGTSETNREVFLQLVFGIGAHAAHSF